MVWRAAVVAIKSGKELTTALTPHNYRNGVHPHSVAFFLVCLENYFLMKCSEPGGGDRLARAVYGPSQPRARVLLLSRTVFLLCNAFVRCTTLFLSMTVLVRFQTFCNSFECS